MRRDELSVLDEKRSASSLYPARSIVIVLAHISTVTEIFRVQSWPLPGSAKEIYTIKIPQYLPIISDHCHF